MGPGILLHIPFVSVHVGAWPLWSMGRLFIGSGFYMAFNDPSQAKGFGRQQHGSSAVPQPVGMLDVDRSMGSE